MQSNSFAPVLVIPILQKKMHPSRDALVRYTPAFETNTANLVTLGYFQSHISIHQWSPHASEYSNQIVPRVYQNYGSSGNPHS